MRCTGSASATAKCCGMRIAHTVAEESEVTGELEYLRRVFSS